MTENGQQSHTENSVPERSRTESDESISSKRTSSKERMDGSSGYLHFGLSLAHKHETDLVQKRLTDRLSQCTSGEDATTARQNSAQEQRDVDRKFDWWTARLTQALPHLLNGAHMWEKQDLPGMPSVQDLDDVVSPPDHPPPPVWEQKVETADDSKVEKSFDTDHELRTVAAEEDRPSSAQDVCRLMSALGFSGEEPSSSKESQDEDKLESETSEKKKRGSLQSESTRRSSLMSAQSEEGRRQHMAKKDTENGERWTVQMWSSERASRMSLINRSTLTWPWGLQAMIYLLALGGVAFVLVAKATDLGAKDGGQGSASGGGDGSHRRLGAGPPALLERIAFCLTAAGMVTFFVNILKQPLILGYLLGGVLVGPIGLDIVHGVAEIQDFSSLGLVFLLFMVGLELDVKQLLGMGKVVILSGLFQFPICVSLHLVFFMGLNALGIDFGLGEKAVFYCALGSGISSTMIVAKALSHNADMDSPSGRLTIGILIFQDIWAIVVLAIQPDMGNPKVMKLLQTLAMIVLLILIALAYAKFVMPVVFKSSSGNVELMLVIALCFCFFMFCFAILPFIGQSMELASLVSGVALATYPYSAEFNGKIKYIRDFFIAIFFCGLGMQIPVPKPEPILTAVLVAVIVLACRWIGVFAQVLLLSKGNTRLAAVATINLSEVSEFALVICSLGITYEHIENDTLVIMIWTFAMCAVASASFLPYNYKMYALLVGLANRCRGRDAVEAIHHESEEHDHEDRNIVILGFHKVAAMLIHQIGGEAPELLHRIHVVDFNEKTLEKLRARGISGSYGDISCPDVLEHAVHGSAKLVIFTIPDYLLRGTSNMKLLKVARSVWPECKVICCADSPADTEKLYLAGADYVLRMSFLCALKLTTLLKECAESRTGGRLSVTQAGQEERKGSKERVIGWKEGEESDRKNALSIVSKKSIMSRNSHGVDQSVMEIT